jgi:hypothetical protein
MLFISVHTINIAKQTQFVRNIIVYLFIFLCSSSPDMFR